MGWDEIVAGAENQLSIWWTQATGNRPQDEPANLPDCDADTLPPVAYHMCMLDRNLFLHEDLRASAEEASSERADRALRLIRDEVSFTGDFWPAMEDYYNYYSDALSSPRASESTFSFFRSVNFQTDNWLLLDAAKISFYSYSIARIRNAPEAEQMEHLVRARNYVEAALANSNESISFDLFRFSAENLSSEEIHPVEAYFELRMVQLQLYMAFMDHDASYRDRAHTLAQAINTSLEDERLLQAQGSYTDSAAGYVNRVRLLTLSQSIYHPRTNLDEALEEARASYTWATERQDAWSGTAGIWVDGMFRKDLQHDAMLARMNMGRIYWIQGEEDQAISVFRQILHSQVTTREYGGFLDLGMESTFHLLRIAVTRAGSRAEAAEEFNRIFDWDLLISRPDFREALGLAIREESSLPSALTELTHTQEGWFWSWMGNTSLEFGSNWAPRNTTPFISELDLADLSDQERLGLLIQCVARRHYDNPLVHPTVTAWEAWEE